MTKFPDGDCSVRYCLEPEGRNLRHTPLSSLLSSWIHLAQTVPSSQSRVTLGLLFWPALFFHWGRVILPKLTQRMKLPMFIWLGGKATKCEHSLETPQQFQAYKYITLKTWFIFISFLDKVRIWCISGLSNKTTGIISGFMVTTGPYFPRDPWYHCISKSHRWVGWWAVRNTRLFQSEMGQLHWDHSQRIPSSAPGKPSPLRAPLGSCWHRFLGINYSFW